MYPRVGNIGRVDRARRGHFVAWHAEGARWGRPLGTDVCNPYGLTVARRAMPLSAPQVTPKDAGPGADPIIETWPIPS